MGKFIRLDMKGHWRGSEHRSSLAGVEEHGVWEDGISCYDLRDVAGALENLRQYWMEIACLKTAAEYKDLQVTVFTGKLVGEGSDWEDLAECHETLLEVEAEPFMAEIINVWDLMEYEEEIDEDEYNERLEVIFASLGVSK